MRTSQRPNAFLICSHPSAWGSAHKETQHFQSYVVFKSQSKSQASTCWVNWTKTLNSLVSSKARPASSSFHFDHCCSFVVWLNRQVRSYTQLTHQIVLESDPRLFLAPSYVGFKVTILTRFPLAQQLFSDLTISSIRWHTLQLPLRAKESWVSWVPPSQNLLLPLFRVWSFCRN